MTTIQLIERQQGAFRLLINGRPRTWRGTLLWRDDRPGFAPLPANLKGSTLGWHTSGTFVSYWQLKKSVK